MRYNADEEFKNSIQQLYDNNTYKLSILQIYALEEVLRYGAKDLFDKFLETKVSYSGEQAVNLYDGVIKWLSEDEIIQGSSPLVEDVKKLYNLVYFSNNKKCSQQNDYIFLTATYFIIIMFLFN